MLHFRVIAKKPFHATQFYYNPSKYCQKLSRPALYIRNKDFFWFFMTDHMTMICHMKEVFENNLKVMSFQIPYFSVFSDIGVKKCYSRLGRVLVTLYREKMTFKCVCT